jgi:hypothetical protein
MLMPAFLAMHMLLSNSKLQLNRFALVICIA